MKVEKVNTIKSKYPKIEELKKKSRKTRIGILTVLSIALKNKFVIAYDTTVGLISGRGPDQIIPGNAPETLRIAYYYTKFARIGYIVMLIISIISSIFVKIKWKNFNSKQKKRAKIVLSIVFALTLITTLILKNQKI